MRVFGLFTGVGGLERGLHLAGHETIGLCEIDPPARAVLERRFQGLDVLPDVRRIERLPSRTELLALGFPCQDLSQAGRTLGLDGRKSSVVRHVFRLLRDRPIPWLVIENVPFMLRLQRGAAMRYLTRQLERLGYTWAYRVIDTRAFGLPQRRERVFLLASRVADPARLLFADDVTPRIPVDHREKSCGFYWTEGNRGLGWAIDAIPPLKGGSSIGIPSPPGIWSPRGTVRIVTPDIRDAERLQGFPVGWTSLQGFALPDRSRWKLVGNAVSVPVARWVGDLLDRKPGPLPPSAAPWQRDGAWPLAAYGGPGRETHAVRCSTWPKSTASPSLESFLRYETHPLSLKATSGFYSRLQRSSLKRPAEFDEDLERHLRMSQQRRAHVLRPSTRTEVGGMEIRSNSTA